LIASSGGVDVGMLYIEVLKGDHGATCWIGGCWTDPDFRGIGVMRSLFNYIDDHASEKGWQRQGLGVWADNLVAINSYKSLGFAFAGEKILGDTSGKYFQHMVRDLPTD
jgi:GNAT superfamily N-acetyltransferase